MLVPSVASITRSAFLKLRPTSLGRVFPAMSLSSSELRVRTNSSPMSYAMFRASWAVRVLAKSPLRAPISFSARSARSRRFAVWALCSWTKAFCSWTKAFCSWTKAFCSRTKAFCSRTKAFCSWTKAFCSWTKAFCSRTKASNLTGSWSSSSPRMRARTASRQAGLFRSASKKSS